MARARTRARVYGAIAAAFALLGVIAGISAWRAVEQTRRAEAQLSRAEAAILTAVEGVARIVEQVAAGSESGAIPTALAKSLLSTADSMITGVVALAPDNPRLLQEQGKVLILFARHYRAVGNIEASSAAAERACDLYAELESRPNRAAGAARLHSVALNERGDSVMAEGDRAGALKAFEESLGIARRLAAADPGNAGWARDVSGSLVRIGNVRVAEGDRAGGASRGRTRKNRLAVTWPRTFAERSA